MPARTGAEYIAGLQERPPDIYIHGEQVKDVTTYPGLRNGVHTLARLYDMQHDPALRDELTYPRIGHSKGILAPALPERNPRKRPWGIPAAACHSDSQYGVARQCAAWTRRSGWLTLKPQGFPGARDSGRPVGESWGNW